ncbi:hypothetical protein fugu_014687 [Takifugu bimaculatus]|uniref:Uncharacterized protein n=1 Tax=Takifugu bimaculatus TaxID=433685 RepID=A0A4Z2C1Z7_9TELE|nr:hypothetical protein fugu_014687 [Takifugu bimaculatus]
MLRRQTQVIPGLRVCRHVSAAAEFSTSLTSLRSGRHVQGLTRGLWHNFLPHLFQFVQDRGSVHWKEAVSALRWPKGRSLLPRKKIHTLTVRYLKIIEKSGYQALPWVRYITQNGDYQLRTQ